MSQKFPPLPPSSHVEEYFDIDYQTYCGEVYNAVFRMNRTQYRRQHQAIQTSVENLGYAILFPKKITMKNPQINFILSESFKRAYFEKSKRSFQFLKNGLNHHCSGGSKHRPEISTHAAQETTEPQQEEGSCFVTPLNTAQIPALKLGTSSAW